MTNIAKVIAWKFNNQPGMRCAEDQNGNMQIIEFPGGIPSQVLQDQWTAEYIAAGGDAGIEKELNSDITKLCPTMKAYILAINDGSIVPGSNMTPAQLKAAIKAKL